MTISGWVFMISLGFNAAISVRVSNELGAGNPKSASFSVIIVNIYSLITCVILAIVILAFRDVLSYAFTEGEEVSAAVSDLCPLLAFTLVLNGIQPVLSGYMDGNDMWNSYTDGYFSMGHISNRLDKRGGRICKKVGQMEQQKTGNGSRMNQLEFVVFDVVFLVVGLSLRTAPQFADFILFPVPSILSHLITVFIAARFSGGSLFRYVCYSRLFLFFPCSTWYKCAELVSWSFGHFYPELYDSSLAWTPCLCFFSFVRWFSPLNLWLCFWCIKNVSSGFVVTLAFRLLFFL
ncbi:hypothetical protein F2Q69_00037585 [Brassica cretica]|uniref:Protein DETOXIFICATION n=1 Tax=Brassica cretica TaxID=69181 RepID=A0A8S9SS22_BRACR|nr:hypothetical protein F2Q69_00037585 [Brassica cretica]